MIRFKHRGDFRKTDRFFKKMNRFEISSILNHYGRKGVEALASATPVDSGETAAAWNYVVEKDRNGYSIQWTNDHINKGVPIAIILQYGHGTGTGGYVEGRDYINPAIQPIFDAIAKDAWEEVKST